MLGFNEHSLGQETTGTGTHPLKAAVADDFGVQ